MKTFCKILIALCILVAAFTSCGVNQESYPWDVSKSTQEIRNADERISLQVIEGSVTAENMQFVIYNASDTEIFFGSDYFLQLKIRDTWYDIYPGEVSFTLELYTVAAGDGQLFKLDLSGIYGELPAGEYRIVKEYKKEDIRSDEGSFVWCQFEVE